MIYDTMAPGQILSSSWPSELCSSQQKVSQDMLDGKEIFHRTELCLGVPLLTFVERVMIVSRMSLFQEFKDIQMEKKKNKQIFLISILLSDLNWGSLQSIVLFSLAISFAIPTVFLPASKW